jgi:hypothetical protein
MGTKLKQNNTVVIEIVESIQKLEIGTREIKN